MTHLTRLTTFGLLLSAVLSPFTSQAEERSAAARAPSKRRRRVRPLPHQ